MDGGELKMTQEQLRKQKATQWVIESHRALLQNELENLMIRISTFEDWAEKKGYPSTSMD
jgi:hypothetical protein